MGFTHMYWCYLKYPFLQRSLYEPVWWVEYLYAFAMNIEHYKGTMLCVANLNGFGKQSGKTITLW